MCTGLALAITEVPSAFKDDNRLSARHYVREGREEYQFHWWQAPALLPVQWNGSLQLLPWGSKHRKSPLPYGGWINRELLEGGSFSNARVEDAVIPANLGFARGTWFLIVEGIRAVVIRDRTEWVAYMVIEPSTNYYRNMTEQEPMMPTLLGQVI